MTDELYKDLGVNRKATKAEIKKAYKKKAQQYHPDKEFGSVEKFKQLAHSYAVLSDEDTRKKYDETGVENEFTDNRGRIMSALASIILGVIQSDTEGDIVYTCNQIIEKNITNIIGHTNKVKQQLRQFKAKHGRVINKDQKLNLFENVIGQQEKALQANLDEIIKAHDDFKEMLLILEHYDDLNPGVEPPTQEQGTTNFTIGGTWV